MRATLCALFVSLPALAQPLPERDEAPPAWPRVGGHLGFALPLASWGTEPSTYIGRDSFVLGLTPGVTVKLDARWAVDFEFIALSRNEFGKGGAPNVSRTVWVADPGVTYNFGRFSGGLRAAMQIGAGVPFNAGLVPIVVVPFPLGKVSYFVEMDLPLFYFYKPGLPDELSVGAQFQTGFAF